jgi:ribosomal-protein-serine acetyltransferase
MTRGHKTAIAATTRAQFPAEVRDGFRLELVRRSHAGEFYGLLDRNRDHVGRWMAWVPEITGPESMLAWIRRCQRQLSAGRGFHLMLLVDGDLVGTVGLVEIDWANRATELGYWLGEEAQGRGLMTQACELVIKHVFDDLELHRVQIRCATGNTRSRAIPERLGFREEGILREAERLGDVFVDHVVYGRLRSDTPP